MKEQQDRDSIQMSIWSLVGIIILLTTLLFTSCQSIRYVPVENMKHDSIYINKIQHDSIYQRDSIYVDRTDDTIYIYKDSYIYKYKNLVDTIYIGKTDSIQVPHPVEKQLNRWQSIKLELGGLAFGILFIMILIIIVRIVNR